MLDEDEDAKVEGTGSGFIWDQFGHIVRTKKNNYSDRGICLSHLDLCLLVYLILQLICS